MRISDISKRNAHALGKETNLSQTIEECGELIKAISKYNRTLGKGQITEMKEEEAFKSLIQEVADVSICIEQLIYLFEIEDEVKMARGDAFYKVYKRYSEEIDDED